MRTESNHDRFPIVKRGYDPDTVDAHLRTSVDENDRILDEAAAQIAALETQLEESKKHEEAVHLTILAATKAKEDLLEAARQQANEAKAAGRKQGDGIITDARMQAFQVVTEARKEAEGIVAEARTEAAALIRSAEATAPIPDDHSQSEIALQHRIEEMQNVIAAMETELRARPPTSGVADVDDSQVSRDPISPSAERAVVPVGFATEDEDNLGAEPAPHFVEPEIEEHIEIVVTDTAPITPVEDPDLVVDAADAHDSEEALEQAPPGDESSITDDRDAEAVRRSFYSRRSAKLPRIGTEAGRGAMAAAAGLRTSLTADDTKKRKNSESGRSQEFETV